MSRLIGRLIAGSSIPMLLAAAALVHPVSAFAQVKFAVPYEYQASCQSCHGVSATGDGSMAKELKKKPSDLTTLAQRNDGKFPFLKVFHTIDGRQNIGAHGTREMPVWGPRYQKDIGDKYGPYGGEAAIRARVLELVYYIQSIQK